MLYFFRPIASLTSNSGRTTSITSASARPDGPATVFRYWWEFWRIQEKFLNFLFIIFSNCQCFDSITGEASVEMVGTSRFKQHTDNYQEHWFPDLGLDQATHGSISKHFPLVSWLFSCPAGTWAWRWRWAASTTSILTTQSSSQRWPSSSSSSSSPPSPPSPLGHSWPLAGVA